MLGATAGLVVFTLNRRRKADTATRIEDTNPDYGIYNYDGAYSNVTDNNDYYAV